MSKVTQQEAIEELRKTMQQEYKGAKLLGFSTEEAGDNQVVKAIVSSPLGTKGELIEIVVTKTETGPTLQSGSPPLDNTGKPKN